jgi:two-component system, NarL family, sensor kinase
MSFFKKKKSFFLILSLTVFILKPNSIIAQNGNKIDSLKQIVASSKNDSIVMDVYNKLRRATTYSNQKASQQYTYKFLEYAQKQKDSFHMALANYYLGNSYVASSNFNKALKYYFKSEAYFDRKKDSARLSSVLNGIGAAYENNGVDSLSLKYFLLSRDISRAKKDKRRSGIASNNISNIYKKRGDLTAAIKHLNDAVSDLNNPRFRQYFITLSINLANAYTETKEYPKALSIYNEMLKKIDTVNDALNYAATLRGLGNIYIANRENRKGLQYLKKAIVKYTNGNFLDDRFNTMKNLIDAYKINNQNKKALMLFYEYNAIKDSIFNSEKDKNLTEAIQKYETEKKDKEITKQQLVLKQNETEILKRKSEFRIALFGSILLLIISLGLVLFYRQNQKIKNKQIESLKARKKLNKLEALIEGEEKERKRIAQDLHDGINGDLSVIKYKITSIENKKLNETEKKEYNKAISMLDNAIEQVRHISHNLAPPSLQNFNLTEAIQQYCSKISESNTLKINFQNYGELLTLNKDTETAIYRIVQEAINNIVKHSKATEALIQINAHENNLLITIEDNGIGFNPNNNYEGLGLKNIRSRVELLKGDLNIDSNDTGTSIQINIDLN